MVKEVYPGIYSLKMPEKDPWKNDDEVDDN